jgi:hypothetical protein
LYQPTAYAEYEESDNCVGKSITDEAGKDYRHLHEHCYEDKDTNTHAKRKNPVGVGLDFFLYKGEKVDIENQNKFDSRNDEYSNFTVVKVKSEKGLFQWVADLFKKGE